MKERGLDCVTKGKLNDVSYSKTWGLPDPLEGEGEMEVVIDHGWMVEHRK